jgi:hypothetical protein
MSKFTINTDTYSIVKEMSDSEVGMLFKALYDYQINGTEVTPPEIKIAFRAFLMGFDKDKELSKARSKSGSLGGRPAESKQKQSKAKKANNSNNQAVTLEPRKAEFKKSLDEFLEVYGRDMLNAFYAFWTEPNTSKTKMRFELQKTWDVGLRLSNWARNNKDIATTLKVEEIKYNRI